MVTTCSVGKKAENGVGIAVAEHLVYRVVEVNCVNDRMTYVMVILEDRVYKQTAAYCPQSLLAEAIERELFTTYNPLIDGDFNGHIGEDISGWESVHGGFVYGSQKILKRQYG